MSSIELAIVLYARLNDVDMDTAAYRVLVDIIGNVEKTQDTAGLYDRMFGNPEAEK